MDTTNVTGIILAGVHSWGQDALEDVICRPLLPIAARPLIVHVLDWLRLGGVGEAFVCANSNTGVLRRSLGEGRMGGMDVRYYEDRMPRGPAGCARDAAQLSGGELFVVAEGTLVPKIDLESLLDSHVRSGAAITVTVAESGYSTNGTGAATEPAGIYVFSPAALEQVPASGYQDIKEALIPRLHSLGERVETHTVPFDCVPRVSGASSYLTVNMWAVQQADEEGALRSGYVRVDEAWVHESAEVDVTAEIVGPVIIGPASTIGARARIIGPTTIGVECAIGEDTVISYSAVWDRCTIGTGAIMDHCIAPDSTFVSPEDVVRNTVFGPRKQRRWSRGIIDRLIARCRPGYSKT